MQADHEEERKADKATIAQLVGEASSSHAINESLQTALTEAKADVEVLKKQVANLYAQLQSQTIEVDRLKKRVSHAFEAGVAVFFQNFPHTEKGRQFITSARGQIINNFLFSKQFCVMIGNAAMPFCLHGFENAAKQASAQSLLGELNIRDDVDSSPDIDWHGDEKEEVDFAWWTEVEQEILIAFTRLEIPIVELSSVGTFPLSEHVMPDLAQVEGEPSGVQNDKEKISIQVDLEEEEEEEEEEAKKAPLVRRSRRSSQTSLASTPNPSSDP